MERLPSTLLYLVIFNPTLNPDIPSTDDDEDAQEQAHILFYTSKFHATSRDIMLRQVGLARALIEFSSVFSHDNHLESIHSTNKRMIIVSPEPNYWIHACIELSKGQMNMADRQKGSREQGLPSEDSQDSRVFDVALRSHMLRAYELFKISHGSFDTVLKAYGKEALELQLERFFTIWAWKWDVTGQFDFGTVEGMPIHPSSPQLIPVIEKEFSEWLPNKFKPLVLLPPYIITSRDSDPWYPISLPHHLLGLSRPSEEALIKGLNEKITQRDLDRPESSSNPPNTVDKGSRLFPIPSFGKLSIRKWKWPDPFGGPSGGIDKVYEDRKLTNATHESHASQCEEGSNPRAERSEAKVDEQALQDALSSIATAVPSSRPLSIQNDAQQAVSTTNTSPADAVAFLANDQAISSSSSVLDNATTSSHNTETASVNDPNVSKEAIHESADIVNQCIHENQDISNIPEVQPFLQGPKPTFRSTLIHLSENAPTFEGHKQKTFLVEMYGILLALVLFPESSDDHRLEEGEEEQLLENVIALLRKLKTMVDIDEETKSGIFPASLLKTVFQKSQHMILTSDHYISTSPEYSIPAKELYPLKELLEQQPNFKEMYSRSRNPQDWHLAKVVDGPQNKSSQLYMEIVRKDATLSDVDSELAAVSRQSIL